MARHKLLSTGSRTAANRYTLLREHRLFFSGYFLRLAYACDYLMISL